MLFSLMAYLFVAIIYNEIYLHNEPVSPISIVGYLMDTNLNYAARGMSVTIDWNVNQASPSSY